MRTPRVLGILGVLAALLLPFASAAPTSAAGATVTVENMAFSPASVRVGLGESVTWSFQDPVSHTATSDDGFFDTGPASGGASRSVRFPSAGVFAYHCSFHPMMHGRITVPMAATGSVKDGWKLRWLAGDNPKGRSYDVQVRRPGSKTWTSFKKGTTTGSGRFDPGAGSWQARARTVKGSSTSGWSPVLPLP
ncbi:MAG: cupredoxin domain-containing protein [Nocardioides sp.]